MYRLNRPPSVYFRRVKASRKRGFPWLPLILLAASVYVFWILPRQFPARAVQVEFTPPQGSKSLRTVKPPQRAAEEASRAAGQGKNSAP